MVRKEALLIQATGRESTGRGICQYFPPVGRGEGGAGGGVVLSSGWRFLVSYNLDPIRNSLRAAIISPVRYEVEIDDA